MSRSRRLQRERGQARGSGPAAPPDRAGRGAAATAHRSPPCAAGQPGRQRGLRGPPRSRRRDGAVEQDETSAASTSQRPARLSSHAPARPGPRPAAPRWGGWGCPGTLAPPVGTYHAFLAEEAEEALILLRGKKQRAHVGDPPRGLLLRGAAHGRGRPGAALAALRPMAPAAPSSPSSFAAAAGASQQPHRGASLAGPGKEGGEEGRRGGCPGVRRPGKGVSGSGAAAPEPLRAGADPDRSRP